MAKQITQANTVLISDQLTTTSQIVAEKFGKQHKDVLRKIETLDVPDDFNQRNFALVEYTDSKGERRPSYTLTRDGFALLVMGFTGKRAMGWKIKFLEAFNLMAERAQLDNTSGRLGYEDGLRAMLRHKSPEELAAWAHGDRSRIDKVIDYLETRLLDDTMAHAVHLEASHILTIAKALRGDTPETRLIPVRAHLRKATR